MGYMSWRVVGVTSWLTGEEGARGEGFSWERGFEQAKRDSH